MKEDFFQNLVIARFKDRDLLCHGEVNQILSEQSSRGVFHSSMTLQRLHRASEDELKESAAVIVKTAIDTLRVEKSLANIDDMQSLCAQALEQRRVAIEVLFKARGERVYEALQNMAMIDQFTSLDRAYDLHKRELTVDLAERYEAFRLERGENLMEQLKNRFLDRPIVAVIALAVITLIAIFAFIGATNVFE